MGCGSFCLPHLCSGEDEDVLGQATTHLLAFPLPFPHLWWVCPFTVLDTHGWLWGFCCSPPAPCLCIFRRLAAKASFFLWVYFYFYHSVIPWWGVVVTERVHGCGWDCSSGAFTSLVPALHPSGNDHQALSLPTASRRGLEVLRFGSAES